MSPGCGIRQISGSVASPMPAGRTLHRGLLACGLLSLLLWAVTPVAHAHTRSQSFSSWSWSGAEVTGRFTIDARRATLLYADVPVTATLVAQTLPVRLAEHLADTVRLQQGDVACPAATAPSPQPAAAGWLAVDLQFICPRPLGEAPASLQIDALFRYAATHLHIAQIARDGQQIERVLTPEHASLELSTSTVPTAVGMRDFVWLGATHVASGWDHIAFLAALLLLISGWRARLWTVTGFTIGHSITLALVASGQLLPDGRTVEALIGFSVLYAALDAARERGDLRSGSMRGWLLALGVIGLGSWLTGLSALAPGVWLACLLLCARLVPPARPGRHARATGPLIATAFGLIHGAGFAGALLDLAISTDSLWRMLLGFNLGVELGQLGIVLVLAAAGALLQHSWTYRRPEAAPHWPATFALCGLAALGSHWFLLRALGG